MEAALGVGASDEALAVLRAVGEGDAEVTRSDLAGRVQVDDLDDVLHRLVKAGYLAGPTRSGALDDDASFGLLPAGRVALRTGG